MIRIRIHGSRMVAGLAALLVFPVVASAVIVEYAGDGFGLTYYTTAPGGTYGTEFISSVTTNVIALGLLDYNRDGFVRSHDVGLWKADGTLLATVNLAAGLSGTLIGDYRYVIASAPIVTGQVYVLGGHYSGGDIGNSDYFRDRAVIDPAFTMVRDRYDETSGGLVMPTATAWNDPSRGFFGPNMRTNIPEPGALWILGIGLVGMGAQFQRRRKV